jgi:hypothetical protein
MTERCICAGGHVPSSVAAPGRLVKLAATRARSRRWVGSQLSLSWLGVRSELAPVGAVRWRYLVASRRRKRTDPRAPDSTNCDELRAAR